MISDKVSKLPLGKGQGLIDETMNHCANFAGDRFDVVSWAILNQLNSIFIWMDRLEWVNVAMAADVKKKWRLSGIGWRSGRNHGRGNRAEKDERRAR